MASSPGTRTCMSMSSFRSRLSGGYRTPPLVARAAPTKLLDHDEKERYEEDSQEGGREHAPKHAGPDGLPAGSSCACRDDQRHHSENERHRGHDDRAKAQPGSFDGRLLWRHAGLVAMIRKLHD